MKKYDVNCPSCCGTFHQTTERFTSDKYATGDMLTLKQQFKDNGWGSFPEYDSTTYADLVCPSCEAQYCNDAGRVIRLQENGMFSVNPGPLPGKSDRGRSMARVNPFVPVLKASPGDVPENTNPLPIFQEDGRSQCPHCEKRVTKQWWDRHQASHMAGE